KLETLLKPTTSDMAETVPLIAGLLGISIAGRYEAPQLTSDILKRRTLEALAGQMIALARIKPVYWLIEVLGGGKSLPAEVLDQIVGKTDGIPLFIEELTKTVLESGLMTERDGRY